MAVLMLGFQVIFWREKGALFLNRPSPSGLRFVPSGEPLFYAPDKTIKAHSCDFES